MKKYHKTKTKNGYKIRIGMNNLISGYDDDDDDRVPRSLGLLLFPAFSVFPTTIVLFILALSCTISVVYITHTFRLRFS
jgi:hypothetical protein